MTKSLHNWIMRLCLILAILSTVKISNEILKCYQTLTVEAKLKDYAITLKNGTITEAEYFALARECGQLGYTLEIEVDRLVTSNGYEVRTNKSNDLIKNALPFKLEQWDFIHLTAKGKDRTIQATHTYRAED